MLRALYKLRAHQCIRSEHFKQSWLFKVFKGVNFLKEIYGNLHITLQVFIKYPTLMVMTTTPLLSIPRDTQLVWTEWLKLRGLQLPNYKEEVTVTHPTLIVISGFPSWVYIWTHSMDSLNRWLQLRGLQKPNYKEGVTGTHPTLIVMTTTPLLSIHRDTQYLWMVSTEGYNWDVYKSPSI